MAPFSRRRCPRTLKAQYELYVDTLCEDEEFRREATGQPGNLLKMQRKWAKLSQRLNDLGPSRTPESWCITFKNWRTQTRHKNRTLEQSGRELSKLEKIALSIWDVKTESKASASNNARIDSSKPKHLLVEQNRLIKSVLNGRDANSDDHNSDANAADEDNTTNSSSMKRSRGPRASQSQFELYVRALLQDKQFRARDADRVEMEGKWAELADRLNAIGTVKSPEHWRITFKSWKHQVHFKRRTMGKHGRRLSDVEKVALAIWDGFHDKDDLKQEENGDAAEDVAQAKLEIETDAARLTSDDVLEEAETDEEVLDDVNDDDDDEQMYDDTNYEPSSAPEEDDEYQASSKIPSREQNAHRPTEQISKSQSQPVNTKTPAKHDNNVVLTSPKGDIENETLTLLRERVRLKQENLKIILRREQREIERHEAWMLEHTHRIASGTRAAIKTPYDDDPLMVGEMAATAYEGV